MNYAHLHLLLNHIPVIGTIIAVGLFLVSFFGKSNEDLRRTSYILFATIALFTIPTFMTGFASQSMVKGPGVEDLVRRHESSALLSVWFMLITGTLALVGLWQSQTTKAPAAMEHHRCVDFFAIVRRAHFQNLKHRW